MSYAPPHPGAETLKRPFLWSVLLHGLLLAFAAFFRLVLPARGHLGRSRRRWFRDRGASGELPGVTLPRPEAVTTSRVVDTSKGLYKSEPKPKPKEMDTDAQKIPEFTKEKAPHYVTRPSKILEDKTPPPAERRAVRRRAARPRCRIRHLP